jgi:hypothetical protein
MLSHPTISPDPDADVHTTDPRSPFVHNVKYEDKSCLRMQGLGRQGALTRPSWGGCTMSTFENYKAFLLGVINH